MNKDFKIIAETAFSHQGDFDYLIKQIDSAHKGNCDYVKFQILIDPENYFIPNHPALKEINSCIYNNEEWSNAISYAFSKGLKIIVLPLTVKSCHFCAEQIEMIDGLEIHSVCFNEVNLIQEVNKYGKKVFLGIGGRLPEEIDSTCRLLPNASEIIFMYGFQSFPTDPAKIDLLSFRKLLTLFPVSGGFADHTFYKDDFSLLNCSAYLLGAKFFEKHIVLKKGEKRFDYESGVDADGFLYLREQLDFLNSVLGEGNIFSLNDREVQYRNREKKIVAAKNIKKNEKVSVSNFEFKVTTHNSDFEQLDIHKLFDKRANKDIKLSSVINNTDFFVHD